MRNLNRVTLIGQLTAHPELKNTPSGSHVADCSVATNYSWKDPQGSWKNGVDFHRCVAWGKVADFVTQHCEKGSQVIVEGKLRTRSWTAEDGTKRFSTEIVVNRIGLIASVKSALEQSEGEEMEDIPFLEEVVLNAE